MITFGSPLIAFLAVLAMTLFSPAFGADAVNPRNAAAIYRQALERLPHSANDLKAYSNWQAQPLDRQTMDLLARLEPVRDLLSRATKADRVDWGWDYSKGLALHIPELNMIRVLSDAVALSVRAQFEHKQSSDAIDGALDMIVLARRLSDTPLTITNLIARGVQNEAVAVVAAYLPSVLPTEFHRLSAALDLLPRLHSLSDAVSEEMKANGDPQLGELAKEATRITSLPPIEAAAAATSYHQKVALLPESQQKSLLKAPERIAFAQAQAQEQFEMLRIAIAIENGGPRILSSYKDPVTKHPFTYQAVEGGFSLSSDALGAGNRDAATLVVGPEGLK